MLIMKMNQYNRNLVLIGSIAMVAFVAGSPARAQGSSAFGRGMSSDGMPNYNFSGAGIIASGSSAYLPFGGPMSGFIPYSPGPGGGLGVQSQMANPVMRTPPGGMTMPGARPDLGSIRSRISPLIPIGSMGSARGGRMGFSGMMIQRAPAGGSMGGMTRPPVGGYPFRQPPTLLGPGSAPAMSM
jgi:hypothetical protein